MRNKVTAYLLLLLFSFVIAFPGYSRQKKSSAVTTVRDMSAGSSLANLIKKCLGCGINAIEEERSSEEDDDTPADESDYLAPAESAALSAAVYVRMSKHFPGICTSEWTEIHCPPPNSFIGS